MIALDKILAIDVHTHVEVGRHGEDGLLPEWREAAARYFGEAPTPTVDDVAAYYRERKMAAVVFSVDAETFMSFARALPCGIDSPRGEPLLLTDLVDFDMCWAFDLVDPWGNQYELNCYDYDRVRSELVEADAVEVVRYWPRELFEAYVDHSLSSQ